MTIPGPLSGLKVIEIAGLGPVPYCGMMLADAGAEVTMIERIGSDGTAVSTYTALERGRRHLAMDLKRPEAVEILLSLVEHADAMFEGFRPGVAERLGFGPDACMARNPRLVYGRVTGWGREGPLAQKAGHDINYIALTGVLHAIGTQGGKPVVPLNVIADFGGGGLLLAFGMMCALLHARATGHGQVVDAAMIDGAASFMAPFTGPGAEWGFDERPGMGVLAGAPPYYDTYETADNRFLAIGSLEPVFYSRLLRAMQLDEERFLRGAFPALDAVVRGEIWPELKRELAAVIKTRTRDEWCAILADVDACCTPVLTLGEAMGHPHHRARGTFVDVGGAIQPGPAPRFGGTPAGAPLPPRRRGEDTRDVLRESGLAEQRIDALIAAGVVSAASA